MVIEMVVAAALALAAPDAASSSGYASVNGVKLYYEMRGEGAPVVLLHGGINTLETTFANLMPELARKYRVVAVEQVGHGHSPDTEAPRTYAEMADDTAALLGHLGISRADLVGWSDGGIIALLVAVRHPERVRRVVASGANIRLDALSPGFVKWVTEVTPGDKSLTRLREAYERVSPDGPAHWPTLLARDRALWLQPVIIEKEKLAAVKAPTLVVSGDGDSVPVEHAVEIFRTLPEAQLCVLPATGHNTFVPRAAWLLPMLTSFLDAPDKTAK
jgi:pimeloyl-ACP methyl ester carboxylesterase